MKEAENYRLGGIQNINNFPGTQEVESIRPVKIQEVESIQPARIQEVESIRPVKIQEVESIQPVRIQEVKQDGVPIGWESEQPADSSYKQLIEDIEKETKVLHYLKDQPESSIRKLNSIRVVTKHHLSKYQSLLDRLAAMQSRLKNSATKFDVYESVPKGVFGEGSKNGNVDVYGNGIEDSTNFGNAYNLQKVDNIGEVISKKQVADLQKVKSLQEIDRLGEVKALMPVKSIQEVKRILPLTDRQADRLLAMARYDF